MNAVALYKRGKVWWTYVVVNGIRHAKSTKTRNRRLAEEVDRDYKHELTFVRRQAPQLNPEMLFEELAAKFLANGGPRQYHHDRLKILLPYFGKTPIADINRNAAREFRQYRHSQKKLSETTVNRDCEGMRSILNWALDQGFLLSNPLARVPMVRERRTRRQIMSVGEELRLLQQASPHLRLMIIAALDTGMRRGEITNQLWQDIDFGRRVLFVSHSKTPEGEKREIPLTTRLFEVFWELRENEGPVVLFRGKSIHRIKTGWKAALRRAGVRYCRFHDLRHTFNSRLVEVGVLREVRMALMGHSTGEDVHSIYTHVELPLKREAIQRLEAWFGKQLEELENQAVPMSQPENPNLEAKEAE